MIEFAKEPFIVEDKSKLLLVVVFLKEAIHARNGLKQIVFAKRLADIQNRIARCVEPRQQLRHNDQNLWIARSFEGVNNLTIVLALGLVLDHHPVPELADEVL